MLFRSKKLSFCGTLWHRLRHLWRDQRRIGVHPAHKRYWFRAGSGTNCQTTGNEHITRSHYCIIRVKRYHLCDKPANLFVDKSPVTLGMFSMGSGNDRQALIATSPRLTPIPICRVCRVVAAARRGIETTCSGIHFRK